MVHFFRLLLVTSATCWGLVPLMPSGSSIAATLPSHLSALSAATAAPSPAQPVPSPSVQSQVAKPVVKSATPSPSAAKQPALKPSPSAKSQASPQASPQASEPILSANDAERAIKWLILSLVPVAAVGITLYCLRLPARSKRLSPASAPSRLAVEGKIVEGRTTDHRSPSQRGKSQLANQAAEATVSVQSNAERSNAERPNSEIIEPQSEGSPLARTTRISKVDIVEALIQDLHHPEVAQRRKSIWELGQRGDSRAIQPLVDLLVDADSQQRSLILAAIAEISTRALKPMHRALLMSLQDESADVRKNAIRDITRIYDQMAQVSQLLQYAASDTDPDVQETARWALGQFNRFRTSPEELQPAKPEELPRSRDPRLGDGQRF